MKDSLNLKHLIELLADSEIPREIPLCVAIEIREKFREKHKLFDESGSPKHLLVIIEDILGEEL